jgi:hypothetical protein
VHHFGGASKLSQHFVVIRLGLETRDVGRRIVGVGSTVWGLGLGCRVPFADIAHTVWSV